MLDALNTVVKKYGIPIVKITFGPAHRSGRHEEGTTARYLEGPGHGHWPGHGTVRALCAGLSGHLGLSVRRAGLPGPGPGSGGNVQGLRAAGQVQFGVSGCPFSCAEGLVRDIGITGSKKGWSVSFGGNAGAQARVADIIAKDLTKEDALDLVRKLLTYYKENAKKKERTAKFVTRVGIDGQGGGAGGVEFPAIADNEKAPWGAFFVHRGSQPPESFLLFAFPQRNVLTQPLTALLGQAVFLFVAARLVRDGHFRSTRPSRRGAGRLCGNARRLSDQGPL